jgi:hypothetical protein
MSWGSTNVLCLDKRYLSGLMVFCLACIRWYQLKYCRNPQRYVLRRSSVSGSDTSQGRTAWSLELCRGIVKPLGKSPLNNRCVGVATKFLSQPWQRRLKRNLHFSNTSCLHMLSFSKQHNHDNVVHGTMTGR